MAKGKYHVTNEDLLREIKKSKQEGKITQELGRMFLLIAEKFSMHKSFYRYSFREDMVSEAALNLCLNGLKFDDTMYSNPFSYYTTAVYRSFLQFLSVEKKHRNIRDKLLLEYGSNPSFTMTNENHDNWSDDHGDNQPYGEVTILKEEADPVQVAINEKPKKSGYYGLGGRLAPNKKKQTEVAPVAEPQPSQATEIPPDDLLVF